MINQIRADLYRQFHTIGFYLIAALTIILSAGTIAMKSVGGIVIMPDDSGLDHLINSQWTAVSALKAATVASSMLVYLYIGLFVIIIGYEFSQHVYKNTLLAGLSRLAFILAKYVTLVVDLFGLLLLYYVTAIVTSGVAGRPVGESVGTLTGSLLAMAVTITFFLSAIFSLAILVLVSTNSQVISALVIALWPLLVGAVESLMKWGWLKYFDLIGVAQEYAIGSVTTSQIWPYLGVGVGMLVVTLIGSAIVIRRREL